MIYDQKKMMIGVTGHNPSHSGCPGYPKEKMHEHVKYAKELGVKLYRCDTSEVDDEWFDELVNLLWENDMEVMPAVYNPEYGAKIAKRYKGKIKYYQVHNEVDGCSFKSIPGQPDFSGREIEHYHLEKLEKFADVMRKIIVAIKENDPDAQTCINGTWMHFGMVDYMLANGVNFDVLGWDWYSNMEAGYGIENCIEDMLKYDKDIIICETNIWPIAFPEEYMGEYLTTLFDKCYNHPSNRIKAVVVYQLLDDMKHSCERERYFGLIKTDEDCNILDVKPAYKEIQKLLIEQ